ncbi:probable LRR receptor-like serine/threonine-protein kinase [Tanacetum coccineum]
MWQGEAIGRRRERRGGERQMANAAIIVKGMRARSPGGEKDSGARLKGRTDECYGRGELGRGKASPGPEVSKWSRLRLQGVDVEPLDTNSAFEGRRWGGAKVRYLILDSNELYGTLPSAISNCSSLIQLTADYNLLQGLIPASIDGLPELEVVSLTGNLLSGLVPVSLLFNPNSFIKVVKLGFNMLTCLVKGVNVSTYSKSVLVLQVNNNRINERFPIWLTSFQTLERLYLSGNMFYGKLPSEIGNMLSLKEFKDANNSLTGELPDEIRKCRLLNVVDLEGNRLSGVVPDVLG